MGTSRTTETEMAHKPRKDRTTAQLPVLMAVAEISDDPHMEELLNSCTKDQQRAIVQALRSAYDAGQEAADQRSGRLMARIFGGFVGVTPGIDIDDHDDKAPRSRLRDMVRMVASVSRNQ
jgi:hypothetical protein